MATVKLNVNSTSRTVELTDPERLGAGEAASAPVAAALGNAVFDATGARLRTVPFRPERVLAAFAGRDA